MPRNKASSRIVGTQQNGARKSAAIAFAFGLLNSALVAADYPASNSPLPTSPVALPQFYIREYRVSGTKKISAREVGEAVYPFLGPGRTADDVEQARAALEKAYKDKGFETVTIEVPAQNPRAGIIVLRATENAVGRLRIRGSRYFSLDKIKKQIPSLAEGGVPNFNDVTRELIALNQHPDRKITPSLKAGVEPGTVDIDLNVKDTFPLHGALELNNRYSADTTPLRLNGSLSYSNLWQLGHTLGFNFQIAPEKLDDAKVFSGYYIARFESLPWLNLMLQGVKQDSNVSTLGGAAVAGRGEILGARAIFTLPQKQDFYHTLSFGFDYKRFDENIVLAGSEIVTPITYYPFALNYNATWLGKSSVTELNTALNFHFRGMGSDSAEFDAKRFKSDGSYIYLRGELAHTHNLKNDWQIYARAQGQAASQALVNSEQFAGGGLDTVRGYLESAALGDNAIFGTLEFRSPSLLPKKSGEWRVYAFVEGGLLSLNDPLPEQISEQELASYGFGTRFDFQEHVHGSLDVGFPLIGRDEPNVDSLLLTYRIWADF